MQYKCSKNIQREVHIPEYADVFRYLYLNFGEKLAGEQFISQQFLIYSQSSKIAVCCQPARQEFLQQKRQQRHHHAADHVVPEKRNIREKETCQHQRLR